MAISYPLALPTVTGIRSIELRAMHAVAEGQSDFTYASQTHVYPGQAWQADITLPPMSAAQAEQWIAFLIALRGRSGSFLLGDPARTTLRGNASSCTITGAAGDTTVSATVPSGEKLLAGDYFQLGTDSDATLHKVLIDYTGAGSAADLEIFPGLRKTRTAAAATLSNAQGLFKLTSNQQAWTINEVAIYGITFGAMEKIS